MNMILNQDNINHLKTFNLLPENLKVRERMKTFIDIMLVKLKKKKQEDSRKIRKSFKKMFNLMISKKNF